MTRFLPLFLLISCATPTDSAEPTLAATQGIEWKEYEGGDTIPIRGVYPLVMCCREERCDPSSWVMLDSLTVSPSCPGRVVVGWLQ